VLDKFESVSIEGAHNLFVAVSGEMMDCPVRGVRVLRGLGVAERGLGRGTWLACRLGAKFLVCHDKVQLLHVDIELHAIKGFGIGTDDHLCGGVFVELID